MITPASTKSSAIQAEANGPKGKGGIADAARQFEALLISQLLKSACDASTMTGSCGEGDTAGATAIEMAQEQFASALSAGGGMGLAKMVSTTLPRDSQ